MDRNPLEYSLMALLFIFLPTMFGIVTFEVVVWAGMSAHWAKGPGWVVGIAVAILQLYLIVSAYNNRHRRW